MNGCLGLQIDHGCKMKTRRSRHRPKAEVNALGPANIAVVWEVNLKLRAQPPTPADAPHTFGSFSCLLCHILHIRADVDHNGIHRNLTGPDKGIRSPLYLLPEDPQGFAQILAFRHIIYRRRGPLTSYRQYIYLSRRKSRSCSSRTSAAY